MDLEEEEVNYIIMRAYPNYKRPYIFHDIGKIKKSELNTMLLDSYVELFDYKLNDIKTIDDVKGYLFYEFYSDYYMDNAPWEAYVPINGEWINVTPTYEEIFEKIKEVQIERESNTSNDSDSEVVDEADSIS